MTSQKTAIVVGAGPVGCLTAIGLAKRGWNVEVLEYRGDPRVTSAEDRNALSRSVNLALSSRGLTALESLSPELAAHFMTISLPMEGRMIHPQGGPEEPQLYDPITNQHLNSISRPLLSLALVEQCAKLTEEGFPITLEFDVNISRINFRTNTLSYTNKTESLGRKSFDFVIGADGLNSFVRQEMIKSRVGTLFNFELKWIPHVWMELRLAAGPVDPKTGESTFLISPNHLHIWPRNQFMLIALPNIDKTFTLTLYSPPDYLPPPTSTKEDIAAFFRQNFGSAEDSNGRNIIDLIGEAQVVEDYSRAKRGDLGTVKISPLALSGEASEGVRSHGVLVGDSAHAMVPFYGQGLNCGFEDVRVLMHYLDQHGIKGDSPVDQSDLTTVSLNEYSRGREKDLDAIQYLAMSNYVEMRSHVLSRFHHLRRAIDYALSLLPSTSPKPTPGPFAKSRVNKWTSLYYLVTFSPDVPYSEALRREKYQEATVKAAEWAVISSVGLGIAAGAAKYWLSRRR